MDKNKDYEVGNKRPPKNRQFGQPGGNIPSSLKYATEMRDFYRWLSNATEDDVKEFIADKSNSVVKRMYATKLFKNAKLTDLHAFTEQIAGKPKETISFENIPTVDISCIGGLPKK